MYHREGKWRTDREWIRLRKPRRDKLRTKGEEKISRKADFLRRPAFAWPLPDQATINVVPPGQKLFLSPVHIFEASSTLKVENEDDDEYEDDIRRERLKEVNYLENRVCALH